jgi:hypothetical protein
VKEGDEEEDKVGELLLQTGEQQAAFSVLPALFFGQNLSLLWGTERWELVLEEGSGDAKEQTEGRERVLKQ